MLWRDGEIKGATGGPAVRFITKILVPSLQGDDFWENQKTYDSNEIKKLEAKGPPDVEVLIRQKLIRFNEEVEDIRVGIKNAERDKKSGGDQEELGHILEALNEMIAEKDTKLFEDVDKIKELPALYESKLGEMRDLVKIIGDKLWRGI